MRLYARSHGFLPRISGYRTAIERQKARKAGERHVENVHND